VNLEPGNIVDGNSIMVQHQIYNRLIETKPGSTDLEPVWRLSGRVLKMVRLGRLS
jgi:peptide/nickel transport system substrate-binding protein